MRVSGINSVSEALKAGKVNKIYFDPDFKSERLKKLIQTAKKAGVPVYAVKNIENKIVAEVSPIKYRDVDYVAEKAVRQGGFLLLLDSVQDPQNLGAVIRNAVFFGCSGVIIPKRRSAQINETVVKVSAGAVFHADIARVANLANTIKNLKKQGFHAVGAEIGGEKIENAFMGPPLAIAVGGEDRGLSNPVKKQCEEIVEIPGYGNVGSLNLSSASAVLMYEFRRRLK